MGGMVREENSWRELEGSRGRGMIKKWDTRGVEE